MIERWDNVNFTKKVCFYHKTRLQTDRACALRKYGSAPDMINGAVPEAVLRGTEHAFSPCLAYVFLIKHRRSVFGVHPRLVPVNCEWQLLTKWMTTSKESHSLFIIRPFLFPPCWIENGLGVWTGRKIQWYHTSNQLSTQYYRYLPMNSLWQKKRGLKWKAWFHHVTPDIVRKKHGATERRLYWQ